MIYLPRKFHLQPKAQLADQELLKTMIGCSGKHNYGCSCTSSGRLISRYSIVTTALNSILSKRSKANCPQSSISSSKGICKHGALSTKTRKRPGPRDHCYWSQPPSCSLLNMLFKCHDILKSWRNRNYYQHCRLFIRYHHNVLVPVLGEKKKRLLMHRCLLANYCFIINAFSLPDVKIPKLCTMPYGLTYGNCLT